MACEKRQRTGSCGHDQCPYSGETDHGYECVEIIGGFCEVGRDCLEKCEYSFDETGQDDAIHAFETQYPEEPRPVMLPS